MESNIISMAAEKNLHPIAMTVPTRAKYGQKSLLPMGRSSQQGPVLGIPAMPPLNL